MKQSPIWLAGAAVALLATPAAIVAQTDAVADLLKEFPTKQSTFFTEYRKLKPDTPEFNKLVQDYGAYLKAFAAKAAAAVKANPKSPSALDLLTLAISNSPEGNADAIALIRANYITDPKIGNLCQTLVYSKGADVEGVLKEIAAKNPNAEAKAQATYGLGRRLANRLGAYAETPVPESEQAATVKRAEGYFNAVIAMYPNNPKAPLAERSRRDLIGLGNVLKLQVGKTAPEITGEDIDGVKFKLSDYRGRVIMLDFWGNW